MMGMTCQKYNFKVSLSENGLQAFQKVRSFVESFGKVRNILQDPEKHYQRFTEDDYQIMMKTIKNYDFIILDLNMPILNGYDACKRICEVYQSFNSLPDYDDPKIIDQEERMHLESIDKLFIENEYYEKDGSLENLSLLKYGQSSSSNSHESLKNQLKNLKQFYNFKRYFNDILRMKPLMIACSADINSNIKKEAFQAGFDKVIQAPLTDSFLKELVKEIGHKQHIKKIMKMVILDKKMGWRSQEIEMGEVNVQDYKNKTIKQEKKVCFILDDFSN